MPVITALTCDTIIHYLQTEALKDAVIRGPLIDDVVDLLNDNGYIIPLSNRSKPFWEPQVILNDMLKSQL